MFRQGRGEDTDATNTAYLIKTYLTGIFQTSVTSSNVY
jgi:hypothetical protein